MKNSIFRKAALICFAAFLFAANLAMGQALFGTANDERFTVVKAFGNDVYAAGYQTIGTQNWATISRFSSVGARLWTRRIDTLTGIGDFLRTDDGNLLLVGINGQYVTGSNASRSMVASVSAAGALQNCRFYDFGQRETVPRIVRDPQPSNANFPYLILGIKTTPTSSSDDDIFFASCNATGQINSARIENESGDFQLSNELLPLSSGGFAICGSILTTPHISFFNASLTGTGGWNYSGLSSFNISSVIEKPTAAGVQTLVWTTSSTSASAKSNICRTNRTTGAKLWAYESAVGVSFLKVIDRGGHYYVLESVPNGNGSAVDYRVVRLTETANETGVTIDWSRTIRTVESSISPMSIAALGNGWVWADGRANHPNSLGGLDGFLAVTDLDFGSCSTVNTTEPAWTSITVTATARTIATTTLTVPTAVNYSKSTALGLLSAPFCTSCDADFTIEKTADCPTTYAFVGSSGSIGGTFFWNFGDGETGTGANVTHEFPFGASSYNVWLFYTAIGGCMDTVKKTVAVTVVTPMDLLCPSAAIVIAQPNACSALMPSVLTI